MTMKYNGGPCDQSFTIQPFDKFDCSDFASGPPSPTDSAFLFITERDDSSTVYFAGAVDVGSYLNMTNGGDTLSADTTVSVYADLEAFDNDDNPLQQSNFHSSCSKNLFLKDKFGSVQVAEFENEDGVFSCFVPVKFTVSITNDFVGGLEGRLVLNEFTSSLSIDGIVDEVEDCLPLLGEEDRIVRPGDVKTLTKPYEIDATVRRTYGMETNIVGVTPDSTVCTAMAGTEFVAGNAPLGGSNPVPTPTPRPTTTPSELSTTTPTEAPTVGPSCFLVMRETRCEATATGTECGAIPIPDPSSEDECDVDLKFTYTLYNPAPLDDEAFAAGLTILTWKRTRNGKKLNFMPSLPNPAVLTPQVEARLSETVTINLCSGSNIETTSFSIAVPVDGPDDAIPCMAEDTYSLRDESPTLAPVPALPNLQVSFTPTAAPTDSRPLCRISTEIQCKVLGTPGGDVDCEDYVSSLSCLGPLETLTFTLSGGLCEFSDNDQESSFSCTDFGGIGDRNVVSLLILNSMSSSVLFQEEVEVGGDSSIVLTADLTDNILISISPPSSENNPTILQSMTIRTSCDGGEDISVRDTFGALEVTSLSTEAQGIIPNVDLIYTYRITNLGTSDVSLNRYEAVHNTVSELFYPGSDLDQFLPADGMGMQTVVRTETVNIGTRETYFTSWNAQGAYSLESGTGTCSASGNFPVTMGVVG